MSEWWQCALVTFSVSRGSQVASVRGPSSEPGCLGQGMQRLGIFQGSLHAASGWRCSSQAGSSCSSDLLRSKRKDAGWWESKQDAEPWLWGDLNGEAGSPVWGKAESSSSAGVEAEPCFSPRLSKAIKKCLPLPQLLFRKPLVILTWGIKAPGESSFFFFVHGQAGKSCKPETASLRNQSRERQRPCSGHSPSSPSRVCLLFPSRLGACSKVQDPRRSEMLASHTSGLLGNSLSFLLLVGLEISPGVWLSPVPALAGVCTP